MVGRHGTFFCLCTTAGSLTWHEKNRDTRTLFALAFVFTAPLCGQACFETEVKSTQEGTHAILPCNGTEDLPRNWPCSLSLLTLYDRRKSDGQWEMEKRLGD
jgi:hypothetical protein